MKLERVQILRFVAAGAVVAFHSYGKVASELPAPNWLWPLRFGGYGVDLFFVISGFIIHLTVRSRKRDWKLFLQRRALRIIPLYWVCTLTVFLLLLVFARGSVPSYGLLIRSLFFLSWTQGPGVMPVVYLGWTLEYEILFYSLIGIAMAIFTGPLRVGCVLLALLAFIGAVMELNGPTRTIHFIFNPILLEFAFGLLIGEGLFRGRIPWLELAPVAVATVMILPLAWGHRVWFAGLPAAALVLSAAFLDARKPLRNVVGKVLAWLGDASYSIYLSQVITISVLGRMDMIGARYAAFEVIVASIFIGGLIGGILLYLLVEAPLRRLVRRRSVRP